MRWVTILAAGYALNQMLAHTDPARIPGLANPAPWRPAGARTAGLIQAGITRLLRVVGLPARMALTSLKSDLQDVHATHVLASAGLKAARANTTDVLTPTTRPQFAAGGKSLCL